MPSPHIDINAAITLTDLRDQPDLLPVMAERIWRAWWRDKGYPLNHLETLAADNLTDATLPFALVAQAGGRFAGTVSVITSDLSSRPQYSPWVAALWVDPPDRQQGIGAALVAEAAKRCFALGLKRLYLCADEAIASFYARRGWQVIEHAADDGDGGTLVVLALDAPL